MSCPLIRNAICCPKLAFSLTTIRTFVAVTSPVVVCVCQVSASPFFHCTSPSDISVLSNEANVRFPVLPVGFPAGSPSANTFCAGIIVTVKSNAKTSDKIPRILPFVFFMLSSSFCRFLSMYCYFLVYHPILK